MSSSGGREITPCLPVTEFLTFFSFTLGNQNSVSVSLWQFLQILTVLKDHSIDLSIQIGKTGFKVDQYFSLECDLLKIFVKLFTRRVAR